MHLNWTSEWKVISIWIFSELPLFNFEHLDMSFSWIGPPCEKFLPFEFLESSCCSISSVSMCDAPELHIRVKSYDHINFSRISVVNFEHLHTLSAWIGPPCEKLWPFEFLESFRFSISSVSIYYAPESDIRVKSYDHLHFDWALVVIFRASLYIMHVNLTSVWKDMSIWISRDL